MSANLDNKAELFSLYRHAGTDKTMGVADGNDLTEWMVPRIVPTNANQNHGRISDSYFNAAGCAS